MSGLLFDLRLSVRSLLRDRAFAPAAVAMLALTIGLNVTVYTVMDAMLFRGFPHVQHNERLVYLQERYPSQMCCLSYADFEDWRSQARAFEAIAYVGGRPITFRDDHGRPSDMRATVVSASTFSLLGVAPLIGRDFVPADEAPGAPPVVMLNHRFWESRFARRDDIVGATVEIDGATATIVGVMPEGFDFPMRINGDLWMPVERSNQVLQRGLTPGGFTAVGRLRDGVGVHQALAELESINRGLEAAYPATNRALVPTAIQYSQFVSGGDAALIWGSLWAGAWFVFLIACANLTNLTLVRTVGRWRELSTKIALGAGQFRMVRQIMMESVLLVSVAGAIGWWMTKQAVRWWETSTASQYQVLDYRVDAGTFAYLVGISLVAALLLSIAPIARVLQLGVSGAVTSDARGATQGRRGKHLAAGLVAGQMALAMVLLSGAGVLLRSFAAIVGAESGVRDPERILVGLARMPSMSYTDAPARFGYMDRLETRLRRVAGVEVTSASSGIPVKFGGGPRSVEIDGRPAGPEGEAAVLVVTAGADYFSVVGAPALSGREFNQGDNTPAQPVAIVNASFAARFWPGEQPLGRRLRLKDQGAADQWRVVVGVVPDIMQGDPLRQQFKPVIYLPFQQAPPARAAFFLARTRVPADQVAGAVRAELQALDPDVTLEHFGSLKANFAFDRDFMDPDHSELGKHAAVAPVFAVIAVTLAAIGLVAVIAHSVTQRTKEIGVRMAIGASARDIRQLVLREGMWPVAIGTCAGIAAALAVNRVLQSQLVTVPPYDPLTMTAAPLTLIAIALLACHQPARRATRVDPVVALRHE